MTVLFAGSELTSFTPSDPTNVTDNTSQSSARDTTYCRAAVAISQTTNYAEGVLSASATTCWLHCDLFIGASSASQSLINFYNSSGTNVFRLYISASSTVQMQYWNGSTWVNIGSTFVYTSSSRYTIDIKIVCGGSGSAVLYLGGTLNTSGSASMSSVDNIAKIRLQTNASTNSYYSQVIVADESTIGWKLATLAPSANGNGTAWTGAYTDVDEAVLDDADFISSATADEVETYAATDASAGSLLVKAVAVSARAKVAATGPQNLQMAVRSGGTTYFSPSVTGLGAGFGPVQAVWATDPATSAAWTVANANSAEIGVKSIA